MKRLLAILIVLGFLVPASAQDPAAVPVINGFGASEQASAALISIEGPAEAKNGDKVTLKLVGTPSLNLGESLTDQLDWLIGKDRMYAYLILPDNDGLIPLDVEGVIVFGVTGPTLRPLVNFVAGPAGRYIVLIDWHYGQDQLVEHTVTVGGVKPPDPPVPTPGKLFCLLSYENDGKPEGELDDLVTDPAVRKYLNTHCAIADNGTPEWRFFDLSREDGSMMPADWQAVIKRAKGQPTPWLVLNNGKDQYEGPNPRIAVDLLALLKKYGGE